LNWSFERAFLLSAEVTARATYVRQTPLLWKLETILDLPSGSSSFSNTVRTIYDHLRTLFDVVRNLFDLSGLHHHR
jgi:hypothetical protein